MRFKPVKSSHRSTVENNRPIIFISATARYWRWKASIQGKRIAAHSRRISLFIRKQWKRFLVTGYCYGWLTASYLDNQFKKGGLKSL